MGFDFYYTFKLNAKRTSENIKEVLECAAQLGYTFFYTPDYLDDGVKDPVQLDIRDATRFLTKEHEKSKIYSNVEFYKANKFVLDFNVSEKEEMLTVFSSVHVSDYDEVIQYLPKTIEILRPFKINYFEMQEEYFLEWVFPVFDQPGPSIYSNLKAEWPVLAKNIAAAGYKVLDAPAGKDVVVNVPAEHPRHYEFSAYLSNGKSIIKTDLSGGEVYLFPLQPYVTFDYATGTDVDTAYYLQLLFKLSHGSCALDLIEAKGF